MVMTVKFLNWTELLVFMLNYINMEKKYVTNNSTCNVKWQDIFLCKQVSSVLLILQAIPFARKLFKRMLFIMKVLMIDNDTVFRALTFFTLKTFKEVYIQIWGLIYNDMKVTVLVQEHNGMSSFYAMIIG